MEALLKSFRKVISYHEMEGTGDVPVGVRECSAGFDTYKMVWGTGRWIC